MRIQPVPTMILPKFSIRHLLLMMVGIGVFSACLAGASRGSEIAFALAIAILASGVPFLIYGLTYWVALLVAEGTSQLRNGDSNSIRATDHGLQHQPGNNLDLQTKGRAND